MEYFNEGSTWIVDIDLEKFFDTVPQDRLMSIINRTIHDGDTESLIRKYLQAGVMVKGKHEKTLTGTPQGGNLSPLLSNIMLNELDKELEARGLKFTRYADDCVIVVGSSAAAKRVMYSITDWMERKLGLKVNAEKTCITAMKAEKRRSRFTSKTTRICFLPSARSSALKGTVAADIPLVLVNHTKWTGDS